jgi:hypothetical protein
LDSITDIFRTMHVTAFGLHRLEATAPWGVKQENQTEEKVTPSDKKMSPTDLAHFAMLSRGNCWLSVEGIAEPIPLTGGDCFLLARGTSIVLRDSPRTRPRWSFREIGAKANGNVALCGGGGAPTTIVCGSLSFDRASLRPITQLLPNFILMKADQARTLALHTTVQALASEMEEHPGTPGAYRVGAGTRQRMAWCNFRSSNRRGSECHSRQSEYALDGRIPGRSGGHVSLRIRSTFQRATRTNAAGICNRVADAEGDTAT